MAQTKEIKKKIGSVQNTKKITSAMELVASSKMKKTHDKICCINDKDELSNASVSSAEVPIISAPKAFADGNPSGRP